MTIDVNPGNYHDYIVYVKQEKDYIQNQFFTASKSFSRINSAQERTTAQICNEKQNNATIYFPYNVHNPASVWVLLIYPGNKKQWCQGLY